VEARVERDARSAIARRACRETAGNHAQGMELEQQRALVTGATCGIGRAVVL
jgi:NADP-dependent 3-hydroxy acid dehydrogenase YdfG